jgi:hypothetical protein
MLDALIIMAQLQQQGYPFDVPSISDMHPGIPATGNIVRNLRLDENITIGDPSSMQKFII